MYWHVPVQGAGDPASMSRLLGSPGALTEANTQIVFALLLAPLPGERARNNRPLAARSTPRPRGLPSHCGPHPTPAPLPQQFALRPAANAK